MLHKAYQMDSVLTNIFFWYGVGGGTLPLSYRSGATPTWTTPAHAFFGARRYNRTPTGSLTECQKRRPIFLTKACHPPSIYNCAYFYSGYIPTNQTSRRFVSAGTGRILTVSASLAGYVDETTTYYARFFGLIV